MNFTRPINHVKSKWWFPTAFSCWEAEEHDAINRVLSSDQLTMGPEVEAFEEEFANTHSRKYAVMTNSGSSANLIMVGAIANSGILAKEMLIKQATAAVPAIAWSTTYAPLIQHGFKLKLVDCGESWNAVWPMFEQEPELEVVCSILGNPAFHGHTLSGSFGGKPIVIEDNCESLGARLGDRLCGTVGLMSSFSFFFSHQISAVEGGIVLTDDADCYRLLKMLRAHGWTRNSTGFENAPFDKEYDFRVFGYNVRPVEMHAAIAREQLKKLSRFISARQANLRLFKRLTRDMPIVHQEVGRDSRPSPFGLAFKVRDSETRSKLAAALRENGIDCRLPTGGSFRMHEYGKHWRSQETPNADRVHMTGMFLGNAPWPIEEEINKAVEVMKGVL